MIRTLPIRVEPHPDESLCSWLCTLAYGSNARWADLLYAVGLRGRRSYLDRAGWNVRLRPDERHHLATATSVDAAALTAMTLERFENIGVSLRRNDVAACSYTLWRPHGGSRFCPHCLASTGGRWTLHWSLGWYFACPNHHCLLADTCPRCDCPNPLMPTGSMVPQPTHCMAPVPGHRAQGCGSDLTQAPVLTLPASCPILDAQQMLSAMTKVSDGPQFGIYTAGPACSAAVLADLRTLADQILARADTAVLAARLRISQIARDLPLATPPGQRRPFGTIDRHYTAYQAALGLASALDVMSQSSVEGAARELTTILGRLPRQTAFKPWRPGQTAALTAIQLRSSASSLCGTEQIRHRALSDHPRTVGHKAASAAHTLARVTPALFWPEWSDRLLPLGVAGDSARAALSCALLMTGGASADTAAALLGGVITRYQVRTELDAMAQAPSWQRISRAMAILADHLTSTPTPIDYQRRRALDYTNLPTALQMCALLQRFPETAICRAEDIRAELCTRITGSPTTAAVDFDSSAATAVSVYGNELDAYIDGLATEYLLEHDIDEPVRFTPPMRLLDGN